MTPEDICNKYAALLERASEIVSGAPYWSGGRSDSTHRLTIEGPEATLTWSEIESCYDSYTLESESVSFPAELLAITDAELAAWKKKEDAAYRAREAERQKQYAQDRRDAEIRQYEALKAKYG